jgi:hypothetical protein
MKTFWLVITAAVFFQCGGLHITTAFAEADPVTVNVVVANPSADKTRVIPVKINLPQEVTPEIMLETDGLSLEYDEQKSGYYLYKKDVELKPKETRVFSVLIKDVWFIPQKGLSKFRKHAQLVLNKLKGSVYYEMGKELSVSIGNRLLKIEQTQSDETLTTKKRIGAYRHHLQIIEDIENDLIKMEKYLTFQGGVPIPEMLQESQLKSDAPSTKTTWIVIFTLLSFLGLLGGQVLYTWHRRAKAEREFYEKQGSTLPGVESQKISNPKLSLRHRTMRKAS